MWSIQFAKMMSWKKLQSQRSDRTTFWLIVRRPEGEPAKRGSKNAKKTCKVRIDYATKQSNDASQTNVASGRWWFVEIDLAKHAAGRLMEMAKPLLAL